MNLPVILDIVIGLIFIYLSFSLLSSEIQNLITIILQWRATHLKKSIEELIAGELHIQNYSSPSNPQLEKTKKLTNSLYQNQLIKNLNYSGGKGPLERGFRKIVQRIGSLIERITGNENTFGHPKTGPSYIPSNAFAASLIDTLKIQESMKEISEYKLEYFLNKTLIRIKKILYELHIEDSRSKQMIKNEYKNLIQEFKQISHNYKNDLASLNLTLERILDRLNLYTKKTVRYVSVIDHSEFSSKMNLVRRVLVNLQEKQVLIADMEPSFSNLLKFWGKVIEIGESTKAEFKGNQGRIYQKIKDTVNILPESLQKSLYILAQQATTKIGETDNAFHQFQVEIEKWFDNSMERATGVYKRNARGVAFLIGFTIAIAANVDTLNIIDHLSKDTLMRATISNYSEELVSQANDNLNEEELQKVQSQVNLALDNLELPIGWSQDNNNKTSESQLSIYLVGLKKLLGWIISGIAISMGANFWFNLLKKIFELKK
ncbi:hypothetical protein [Okeania sp.]|uniref:hypothetical protein n=1 Tax=Okeania sp. TaxID=3100323 RepID=UPI002B4B5DA3|nr:hypothetical protein [Okeania sp.]MEB3341613.1 hypothetical protein [Okeania sp.]